MREAPYRNLLAAAAENDTVSEGRFWTVRDGRVVGIFPSGHTQNAFIVATVLTLRSEARWVPWVAYPLAAAVGAGVMLENWHWAGDVLVGAPLGWAIGREAARARGRAREDRAAGAPSWSFVPVAASGAPGAGLRWLF